MINISYRQKYNGLPVLSWDEIDIIAETMLKDYNPELLSTPQPVDIELLMQDYLKLYVEYQYLSNNESILGMMVFHNMNGIVVYEPENDGIKRINAKANTVIIDNSLLEQSQRNRYRFTMAHEAGHATLHQLYFTRQMNDMASAARLGSYASEIRRCVKCRAVDVNVKSRLLETDDDWMEWQANAFASAILLPKSMVFKVTEDCKRRYPTFCDKPASTVYEQYIAGIFDVSREAARCRLNQLGIYTDAQRTAMTVEEMDMINADIEAGQAYVNAEGELMYYTAKELEERASMENLNNVIHGRPKKKRKR